MSDDMKPPPSLALHCPDAFGLDMAYQLRERNHSTLEDM